MPETRQKLKFLLFEARLEQDMVDHELGCLARAAGLPETRWRIVDLTKELPTLDMLNGIDAIFIGGTGDYSVAKDRPAFLDPLADLTLAALDKSLPALGLCYGFHLMAKAVGGRVVRSPEQGETGTFEVILTDEGRQDTILGHLPDRFMAQQGHNDVVEDVPPPFVWLATSERCRWQALKHPDKPFYGLQFHPELGRDDFMVRMRKYAHEYAATPDRYQQIDDQVKDTRIQDVIEKFIDKIVVPLRS
ncbi:type 1 glutamine amidotransferase [bacterium]|nr:type 1 glutamine amidotransferase [bacterium]